MGGSRTDRLQLFMIADQNKLCPAPLDLLDKPAKLATADHASFVDDQDVTGLKLRPARLPAVLPGGECARDDAGRFLESLSGLAGKGCSMHPVALRFPGCACRSQHGRLASTGKADDRGNALSPGDMANRKPLLLAETRRWCRWWCRSRYTCR